MTSRREFLDTVAARLQDGIPDNPIRPLLEVADDPIEYTIDMSDPGATFTEAAQALGAEVVRLSSVELPSYALELCRELGERARVAVTREPVCAPVAEYLGSAGIPLEPDAAPGTLSGVALGITGTRTGVALTGSVVIDSSVPGARVVSLLPEAHLAILRSGDIVPDPGFVLRALDRTTLPSNLVFVTGPSRSADIELQLTIGVHGPSRLVIALID